MTVTWSAKEWAALKKEYFWYYSAVALQAPKSNQEAEVAGRCPLYEEQRTLKIKIIQFTEGRRGLLHYCEEPQERVECSRLWMDLEGCLGAAFN